MLMRKLATIRTISEIRPIPDADAIECAVVDGWVVVVKRGEFKPGDVAVYMEVDSWIPTKIAPFLSRGKEPSTFEGIQGERLRTVKLRGQLSQGLLIKYTEFPKVVEAFHRTRLYDPNERWFDVTDILGIVKWEAPIPAQLSGQVRGAFPSSIPKTDQERIQNLTDKLPDWKARGYHWEVTEKLDGTSMTVFLDRDGRFGVCGRNWELTETAENSLWRAARADSIEAKLRDTGRALALQGELIGEGIQGNPYKLKGQRFYVYDVYDISETRYWSAAERLALTVNMGINHVPLIGIEELDVGVDELLKMAEGKSRLCETTEREGLVFKCTEDTNISFKCISNRFLLKSGN
jgi:RNA ligase (TIGR02306 family)